MSLPPQVVLAPAGEREYASSEQGLPLPELATLGIPVAFAGVSVIGLVVQSVILWTRLRVAATKVIPSTSFEPESTVDVTDVNHENRLSRFVAHRRGWTAFALNCSRLLACLALLLMNIFTAVTYPSEKPEQNSLHDETTPTTAILVIYLYALVLSLAATLTTSPTSLWATHVNLVLIPTWAVYIYRDVFPLTTFTLSPIDAAEGGWLWAKIALLTYVALIVPLIIPRPYTPVDPKHPSKPSPEQTASLLSLLLYSWLDGTIVDAYHAEHLKLDQLPPLADYDDAQFLAEHNFLELSPFQVKNKERHIFWGFVHIFRLDLIVMAHLLIFNTFFQFANPLSIKNLLSYIEDGGEGALVRPWVWVLCLFLGPALETVSISFYYLYSMRLLVRMEAMITQLVFEHSLRMRVKAEAGDGPVPQGKTREGKQKGEGKNVQGKVNNLITSDLNAIGFGREILAPLLKIPVVVILCVIFLYTLLGWSALAGMTVVVVLIPLPGTLATRIRKVQAQKMKKTDARVQTVTETMNVIRMIKLFGWESRVKQQLTEKRDHELDFIKKSKMLELINGSVNYIIPLLTMIVTFMTYTMVMKRELTASRVFASMTVFTMFSREIRQSFNFIPLMMRAKVALDRVNDFLHQTELLDEFSEPGDSLTVASLASSPPSADAIGFKNASFTWAKDTDLPPTPGSGTRAFKLRIEGDLVFNNGGVNLIVGPTGCGKTSMLMALLGEMHYIPEGPHSFYQLPRAGGVAYAAQESWVQNETIRDNIIFGSPYDRERYEKVIDQCSLRRDLGLFAAGDLTEVGEKGITLSGGQKARITLARAVYSSAEILLLDDVLAALDVHTARWIINKCFKGDLLRGRTVLLVTHNVAMTKGLADFVVALGLDGKISSQGTLSNALERDSKLAAEVAEEQALIDKTEEIIDDSRSKQSSGKLVVEEEVAVGHVGWSAMKTYLSSLGGSHLWLFWTSFISILAISQSLENFQVWFLGYWARQYEIRNPSDVNVPFYLAIYSLILLVSAACYYSAQAAYVFGTMRGSRAVHGQLISSVLGTTLRWLDKTPTSRMIARCTQDIQAVDMPVPRFLGDILNYSMSMLLKLGAIVATSPIFSLPAVLIASTGGWIGRIYMKAQLSVKRERSNAQAPVLGHFGAAFAGLVSIRAYGAQDAFRKESYKRINRYSRVSVIFWGLNRWVCIRIDALGAIFTAALAGYLVYAKPTTASNTGFSLNMAVGFSGMILWWVRMLNELEVNGNSLERIKQYVEIEQETKPTIDGVPPAYWPASGDLKVENLSARYSPDGPSVLHGISFEVKSGERVGIVGRTGSGKSSLTLSLLCCIITEGKVYYDGIATDSINLDALRSNITIIPQIPELLSGTLRQNLDPFQQYDDAVLNDALRSAGLFSLQSDSEDGKITLDTPIASGGGNLSVGQRQILALARAIVRQSKLLILDEATSAIDYATDAVIQASLRRELENGVTVLTVAHRLHTIMDADKIMVLDAGRIAEFGKPSELLKDQKGMLRALVDESGDKEALYAMAQGASASVSQSCV
ncbi:uncharacterized protein C8Q71DRAFT_789576 [Rhodofomes roseus]|uniref:P-loop containing nucleoside triphosphate hydrolase protein n=1 Tax=Rhodofomes roseus TaxID=34475 RepID=A0ABQ8K0R8_9APHY|nr:uncharacterized protein C8Q71DRAFT_789576 [Rhodofomes roseus]KAH9829694.1 hypothetical protein C8Q71DRAFT_789576 [Rhodofomes roseus]